MAKFDSSASLETLTVHAGYYADIAPAQPTVPPLHVASAFTFADSADLDAAFVDPASHYAYARFGNPTVRALEHAIAALEGADACIAWPSGMAAINGVFGAFAAPDTKVITSRDVYGASLASLKTFYEPLGVIVEIVDITDLEAIEAAASGGNVSVIFAETISNPLMKVADIAALAGIAESLGALLVIDNTFASPILCQPLAFGADLVLHSSTKYLGGHGDVLGGVVSGNSDLIARLRDRARINGAVPGALDAWLTHRGLKTLALRMRAHSENAFFVAKWLEEDPRISAVYFAGLNPDTAKQQFRTDLRGGMISFEVDGFDLNRGYRYLEGLKLIKPAPTLGDVESLSLIPALSSHRGFSPENREAWGIRDNLVRVSVGIEIPDDIIADLDQAISAALAS